MDKYIETLFQTVAGKASREDADAALMELCNKATEE